MDACVELPVSPVPQGAAMARASGKVILLGEHAVVYGVPALAVGIDRGAWASAADTPGPRSVLEVPGWQVRVEEGEADSDLARAFSGLVAAARMLPASRLLRGAVIVSAHAELPPGGGLGCSAAVGVAVARALVPGLAPDEAATLAMTWERVFHGTPSGIDAAVAAHGGSILFERGKPMETVPIPRPLTVCLGSTGVASSTKTMVDGVRDLRARKPEIVEKAFAGIGSLVRNARLALSAGDTTGLGKLMDLNQMLLSGLFLSTEQIEILCGTARDAGALGAKLTGAGGGGSVVALASDAASAQTILAAWQAAGFGGFSAQVQATEAS